MRQRVVSKSELWLRPAFALGVILASLMALTGCTQPRSVASAQPQPPVAQKMNPIPPRVPRLHIVRNAPPKPEGVTVSKAPISQKTAAEKSAEPRQVASASVTAKPPEKSAAGKRPIGPMRNDNDASQQKQRDADQAKVALAYRHCITTGAEAQATRSADAADKVAVAAAAACGKYEPDLTALFDPVGFVALRRQFTSDAVERVFMQRARAATPGRQPNPAQAS